MFSIATTKAGQCTGFPDTCKTPTPAGPVPMPYPNIAMLSQANPGTVSKKVSAEMAKVLTKASIIPMSTGDEAGSAGGVISSKIKGEAQFTRVSTKVKIEGQAAAFHTGTVGMNGKPYNIPVGIHAAPSASKVTVAT